jgi:thioredoxin-like negative regulator of GroEL
VQVGNFGTQHNTWVERQIIASSDRTVEWPVQVGLVPPLADCYQRRHALNQISRSLLNVRLSSARTFVISGLPGTGKTQVACAVARKAWTGRVVDLLLWVSASSEEAILTAYGQAARAIGLTATAEDTEIAGSSLMTWFETTERRWLVILDDVQDPSDLRGLWPKGPRGRLLLTTKRKDAVFTERRRRLIEIGPFDDREARAYMKAKLRATPHAIEGVDALVDDLGLLPLALAQAASYIKNQALSCQLYSQRFRDRQTALAEILPADALADDYHATLSTSIGLSTSAADTLAPEHQARSALVLAAFLSPNGIPEAVFLSPTALTFLNRTYSGRRTPPPPNVVGADAMRDALRVLHRFSLIVHSPHEEARSVHIHGLVQRTAREWLSDEQSTQLARIAADCLVASWPLVDSHLDYSRAIRESAEFLMRVDADALWQSQPHPILVRLGKAFGALGLGHQATGHFQELLQRASAFPFDHPSVLEIRFELAHWRGTTGDPERAVDELTALFRDQVRRIGFEHPETMETKYRLGYWHGLSGRPERAALILAELLPHRVQVLGSSHPDTLATRAELAHWRGTAGQPATALAMFRALLPELERVLGADNPMTLSTRHNIAYWQAEIGEIREAMEGFTNLIPDRARILGQDHPDTLITRGNLAYWTGAQGEPSKAVAMFEELLETRIRTLGPDHPHTLTTRHNVARWRASAGDIVGATSAMADFLLGCLSLFDERGAPTATQGNLFYWRGLMGDAAGAAAAFEEIVNDCRELLGDDNRYTLLATYLLAVWRGAARDAAGAIAILEDLIERCIRALGPDHPDTVRCRDALAHWQQAIGPVGQPYRFSDSC